MSHLEPDLYDKKTVTLRQSGIRLELRVAADLFSSFEVDVGTRLLLRTLADAPRQGQRHKILDLGCGYGPIGLTLKALDPGREVHMVDRDALAVAYSRRNADLNGLAGVEVYGSLGYDDVRATGFDLIASNIPAKAGTAAIRHFLLDAAHRLRPDGLVAVVVVAPLEALVAGVLARPGVEVVHCRSTASYAVFHYRFTGGQGLARSGRLGGPEEPGLGVYDRQRVPLVHGGVRLEVRTAYGLPEFDSLGYQSELAVDALLGLGGAPAGRAVVLNPGQGHVPALLWALLKPSEVHLVDRDLLALRYARANLVRNGCPPERVVTRHQVGLAGAGVAEAGVVVALLREREPPEAAAAAVRLAASELPPGGRLVVAASSTAVTRCLARLGPAGAGVAVRDRRRKKGFSVVVLERAGARRPPPTAPPVRSARRPAGP